MPNVVDQPVTDLQIKVYNALVEAWVRYGAAPSQSELMAACHCSSVSIQNAFKVLRQRGHITAPKHGIRVAKPVDLTRTISRVEPNPWDELAPPKRIWK